MSEYRALFWKSAHFFFFIFHSSLIWIQQNKMKLNERNKTKHKFRQTRLCETASIYASCFHGISFFCTVFTMFYSLVMAMVVVTKIHLYEKHGTVYCFSFKQMRILWNSISLRLIWNKFVKFNHLICTFHCIFLELSRGRLCVKFGYM